MSTGYALRKVVLRTALPGIVTGLLVALAIAGGETAPLLYTAGWSTQTPTLQLTHSPVGYLTYPVWAFYSEPASQAHAPVLRRRAHPDRAGPAAPRDRPAHRRPQHPKLRGRLRPEGRTGRTRSPATASRPSGATRGANRRAITSNVTAAAPPSVSAAAAECRCAPVV